MLIRISRAEREYQLEKTFRLRMTQQYLLGISLESLPTFLAWTGMVTSLIFIIGNINILVILAITASKIHPVYLVLFSVAVPVTTIINIGMFIYSNKLWRTIKSNDMVGMKTLVKIGCYIMAALEILATTATAAICISAFVLYLFYVFFDILGTLLPPWSDININADMFRSVCAITIVICVLCVLFIIFISLMIHGVRKMEASLVKIYIIFRMTVFIIYTILVLTLLILVIVYLADWYFDWVLALVIVNIFLASSFLYIYSAGFIVLSTTSCSPHHT